MEHGDFEYGICMFVGATKFRRFSQKNGGVVCPPPSVFGMFSIDRHVRDLDKKRPPSHFAQTSFATFFFYLCVLRRRKHFFFLRRRSLCLRGHREGLHPGLSGRRRLLMTDLSPANEVTPPSVL